MLMVRALCRLSPTSSEQELILEKGACACSSPSTSICPQGPAQQSLRVVLGPVFIFQLVMEKRMKAPAAARLLWKTEEGDWPISALEEPKV